MFPESGRPTDSYCATKAPSRRRPAVGLLDRARAQRRRRRRQHTYRHQGHYGRIGRRRCRGYLPEWQGEAACLVSARPLAAAIRQRRVQQLAAWPAGQQLRRWRRRARAPRRHCRLVVLTSRLWPTPTLPGTTQIQNGWRGTSCGFFLNGLVCPLPGFVRGAFRSGCARRGTRNLLLMSAASRAPGTCVPITQARDKGGSVHGRFFGRSNAKDRLPHPDINRGVTRRTKNNGYAWLSCFFTSW